MRAIPGPLWQSSPIEYLVRAKFPNYRHYLAVITAPSGPPLNEAQRETVREAGLYQTHLASLPPHELGTLVEQERADEADRERARIEKVESERPFNQPYAKADPAFWASMSYWTPDEAVALSFGRNPSYASWKLLEQIYSQSSFARSFASRRHIVMRAKEMGQLWEKTTPANFLAWARRMRFEMPAELVDAVTSLGVQIMDWKSLHDGISELYEQLKTQLVEERATRLADVKEQAERSRKTYEDQKELYEQFNTLLATKDALIAQREQVIEAQNAQLAELEPAGTEPAKSEKSLGARERESLLKLTIGMAMRGYSYQPKSGRSPIAKEIAGDLALVGLSMDEDTVRKYLAEAKELLPADETEDCG
jgi:hypothetical protein